MAWIAEDNFNSYSDGDLNGESGGSGWTTAWSGNILYDVQGVTTYEGTKAVKIIEPTGDTTESISRDFTALTSGIVYVSIQRSTVADGGFHVVLREGASAQMHVRFGSDGNISAYNQVAGYVVQQAYNANTWYRIGIEWDNVGQANKWRMNIDEGAFSAWYTVQGATYTNVSRFAIDADSATVAYSAYFDTIDPDYTPSAPSVEDPALIQVQTTGDW